jgi:hypothetical protein
MASPFETGTGCMLSRLLNWIGWETSRAPAGKAARQAPTRSVRARPATSQAFTRRPPATESKTDPPAAARSDFNPYNTGKFDRSASWERISKNQR